MRHLINHFSACNHRFLGAKPQCVRKQCEHSGRRQVFEEITCSASAKLSEPTTTHPLPMQCLLKSSTPTRTRDRFRSGRSSDTSCPSGWHSGTCREVQPASPAPCPSAIFWIEKGLRDRTEQSSYDQRDNMKVIPIILQLF